MLLETRIILRLQLYNTIFGCCLFWSLFRWSYCRHISCFLFSQWVYADAKTIILLCLGRISIYATVRSIIPEWTYWFVMYNCRVLYVYICLSSYFYQSVRFSITVLLFNNCRLYLDEWPFTQIVNQHIYIGTRWNYLFCYHITQISYQWVAFMCHFPGNILYLFISMSFLFIEWYSYRSYPSPERTETICPMHSPP